MPGPFDLTPEDLAQASAQSHQQVDPQTGGLNELRPLPWWKRRLLAMQTQGAQMNPEQQHMAGGSSPVTNWASLGAGVGNLAKKFIGMEHGGVVQGPTEILAGEGGETEYVLPESKVAPWIARTLQSGAIPNPADIPREGFEPPPPVILPPQASQRSGTRPPPPVILPPQMCNGGKVMPRMAQGGMVMPRRVEEVMPAPIDYFNPGDDMVAYSEPVQFNPPPVDIPRPQRPLPQMPVPSFEARQRRDAMLAKGQPLPKWYERPFAAQGGDSQLDMRPGVAPYSIAGRAGNKLINAFLPINRKREQFGREYNAAQMAAETEAAQNAATQKGYESQRAEAVARSQMDANDARRVAEEARAAKLSAPAKPEDPYKGMVEVTPEFGQKAGIVAGPDGKYRLPQGAVRIPADQRPTPETPAQATERRTQEADKLNLKGSDRTNYIAGRNVIRPAAGGGGNDKSDDLLTPNEAMTLGVPYGTTRKGAFGSDPKKPLSESAISKIAEARSAVQSVTDLRKVLQDNEQYIGPIAGVQAVNPWSDARKAQADINRVKQRVGKALEGGVLRKEDEEKYKTILSTLTDDPKTAIYKIDQLIQNLNSDISIFEEEQRRAGRRVNGNSPTQPPSSPPKTTTEPKWTKHTSGVEGVEMTKDGQTVFIEKSKYDSATKKGWKVKGN